MLRTLKFGFVVLAIMFAGQVGLAQTAQASHEVDSKPVVKEEAKFFHLDFVLKELDGGKVINSRSYSMSIAEPGSTEGGNGQNRSLRTGTRVPFTTGAGNQFTYMDVGVNIDCRELKQIGNQLTMNVSAEINSLPTSGGAVGSVQGQPVILQNKWNSQVIVPIGKATVLFSSEDMFSKRTVLLELTATPIR